MSETAENIADDAPKTYEHARDELADVVARLEAGGLTLDESLTLWERGEQLAAACAAFLEGARARVDDALTRADQQASGADGDARPDPADGVGED